MPHFVSADQLAYDAQQRAELEALEASKAEHFRRMADPMAPILARLGQLETEVAALRNRLAAAELKATRNPDDW
jgi:uncharacterized protein YceH (UPF0502 family)